MSYSQTLTEPHPQTLSVLSSTMNNVHPQDIAAHRQQQQQQALFAQRHAQQHPGAGFPPSTPANPHHHQGQPNFPPGSAGTQQFQRTVNQPPHPMSLLQNNSGQMQHNVPPMGALNPVPSVPSGGAPPMYGTPGASSSSQMMQQPQSGMGQGQPSSMQGPVGVNMTAANIARMRVQQQQQQMGNIQGMNMNMTMAPNMVGGGMPGPVPSNTQGGMGGPNAAANFVRNVQSRAPGMQGFTTSMTMTPQQVQQVQILRQQRLAAQSSPQAFHSQIPNSQQSQPSQISSAHGQPSGPQPSGASVINSSPSRPGTLGGPSVGGVGGGFSRDMMALTQQYNMQNQTMQGQNQANSTHQMAHLPGQQQHIPPQLQSAQQQQIMDSMLSQQQYNHQQQSHPGQPQNANSQQLQRPMGLPMSVGGGSMVTRVPSAGGPSPSAPQISHNGGIMGGMPGNHSSPVSQQAGATQPPLQPLQPPLPPQLQQSQGMHQQPFANPLAPHPQHQQHQQNTSQQQQMPQHPSPQTMSSLQQQHSGTNSMNNGMGLGIGMGIGGMGNMGNISHGMQQLPSQAPQRQHQQVPGGAFNNGGMLPPSGTPHPQHASPPRPGTSGGIGAPHVPGAPMSMIGSTEMIGRITPRPGSQASTRIGGMSDGASGSGLMGLGSNFQQSMPQHQLGHQIGRTSSVGGQQFPFPGGMQPMSMPGGVGAGGRHTPHQQLPMAGLGNSPGGPGRGRTPVSAGIGGQTTFQPTPAQMLERNSVSASGGPVQPGSLGSPYVGMGNVSVRSPPRQQHNPNQQQQPLPFSSPFSQHPSTTSQQHPSPPRHMSSPAGVRSASPGQGIQQVSYLPNVQSQPPQHGHQQGRGSSGHSAQQQQQQQQRPPSRSMPPPGSSHSPKPIPQTRLFAMPSSGSSQSFGPGVAAGSRSFQLNNNSGPDRVGQRQQPSTDEVAVAHDHPSPTRLGSLPPSAVASKPNQHNSSSSAVGTAGLGAPPGTQDGPGPSSQASGSIPVNLQGLAKLPQQQEGKLRIMHFSEMLSNKNLPVTRDEWARRVVDFFTPDGIIKLTLWKDNKQTEAKPFEIATSIMPLFFEVTSSSGVLSMSLSVDHAHERLLSGTQAGPATIFVECEEAVWTYKYRNGYTVLLRGPLTAQLSMTPLPQPVAGHAAVSPSWRFEHITFESKIHEKYVLLEAIGGARGDPIPSPQMMDSSIAMAKPETENDPVAAFGFEQVIPIDKCTIPTEPVNAFGIPQATMRCLELAESVSYMADLMVFSLKEDLGPLDALAQYAQRVRETETVRAAAFGGGHMMPSDGMMTNGIAPSPFVTLYQSSPLHIGEMSQGGPAGQLRHSQQNTPGDTASPVMTSTPTAMSGGQIIGGASASSHSTPQLSHTTLKRKSGADTSPAATQDQGPPAKRQSRKARRSVAGT